MHIPDNQVKLTPSHPLHALISLKAHSELRMWHSQAGTMDAPDHTGHWTTMSSTPGEYSIIDYIFQEHPDGMVHSTASEMPTELARLLPESITAGIGGYYALRQTKY